jgi:predicted metal-dependent phosphoesterase TrpH
MHCHSTASDDSRATVEQYAKWVGHLRRNGARVDAIVLTEHRQFNYDLDYTALSHAYGLRVFKGAELDTQHGHFLVYGVTPRLTREVNFADVTMDARELVRVARDLGGLALPAHPSRVNIGLADIIDRGIDAPPLGIVEILNGTARRGENERAQELAASRSLSGIGGSDAHYVSAIATCVTAFPAPIGSEAELVEALLRGGFRPVRLEETRSLSTIRAREGEA